MSHQLSGQPSTGSSPLADAIRSTAAQLSGMPVGACEYFDALAFVLSRIAGADRNISGEEARRMEAVLAEQAGLNPAQSALVVEIARHRRQLADPGRAYRESLQLRRRLDDDERARVLDVLYEIAAADGEVVACELDEIHQVAAELGLTRLEVTALRRGGDRG